MLTPLDNYYFSKPEPQQSCLLFLRQYLLKHDKEIAESFNYGTAFFKYKGKMFCYFSINKKGQLYIGFVHGYKMNHPHLKSEGRKQIKVYYIDPEKDMDVKTLHTLLKTCIKTY